LPRLLYLVTEDWYFWSHRLSLAEQASRQGYEISVVTNPGQYQEKLLSKGFKVYPLTLPRSVGTPLQELRTLITLAKLYRLIKPDLIHHIALKPVIAGSIAAWITRMPRVINAYTGLGYLFIAESRVSRFFISVVAPVMSLVLKSKRFHSIVQNADDKLVLLKLGLVNKDRLSLVRGSGVDTRLFSHSPEPQTDKPLVLFASRLLRDKGIVEFVNAARLLTNSGVPARFIIVGPIDPANPTSITTAELDSWIKEGIIEWWGHRDDMNEVFRQVNIVSLPSYREGLPKVLLEAGACGRPIVTTDVPGCRDVVIDGMNGLLVPVRDADKLAIALHDLLTSPALRYRMGEAGRTYITENFDINTINSATIKIYNDLTASKPDQLSE